MTLLAGPKAAASRCERDASSPFPVPVSASVPFAVSRSPVSQAGRDMEASTGAGPGRGPERQRGLGRCARSCANRSSQVWFHTRPRLASRRGGGCLGPTFWQPLAS